MATFVMNFSMKKFIAAKEKDKAMLKAWTASATLTAQTPTHSISVKTEVSIEPKKNYQMPFYTNKTLKQDKFSAYRWLIV